LLTMGGLGGTAPPVIADGVSDYADPLPQALILTAIVISFGVTAFILVLAYKTYSKHQTDNMDLMRGNDEHDQFISTSDHFTVFVRHSSSVFQEADQGAAGTYLFWFACQFSCFAHTYMEGQNGWC